MKDETKENLLALLIVIVLSAAIGWWIYHQIYATPAQEPQVQAQVPVGASPTLGNESAPMTVVIFSDFECPFCGEFERNTFPYVKEKYIATGKIRFVFKQFPLDVHPHADLAAQASLCAQDQNKFWEYHDILYAHQDALEQQDLESYAADLKLDTAAFKTCLASGEHEAEITMDKTLGTQSSVTGTPTFFFNGRRVVGALTAAEFDAQLQ